MTVFAPRVIDAYSVPSRTTTPMPSLRASLTIVMLPGTRRCCVSMTSPASPKGAG
jgi:hypothetical protein